jgi:hypothetical protein
MPKGNIKVIKSKQYALLKYRTLPGCILRKYARILAEALAKRGFRHYI